MKQMKQNGRPACIYVYKDVSAKIAPPENPAAEFMEGPEFLNHPDVQRTLMNFQCWKIDLYISKKNHLPQDWPDAMLRQVKTAQEYRPLVLLYPYDFSGNPIVVAYDNSKPESFRKKFIEACEGLIKHDTEKRAAVDAAREEAEKKAAASTDNK
jgi:hypothetical protein